jgi:hypothetical protein
MRSVLCLATLLAVLLVSAAPAGAFCRCHRAKRARCADPTAKHALTVHIDLTVVDGAVEVLTQSGPYQLPVADLDGKQILFIVMPRGQVFQGLLSEAIPGGIGVGTMTGATASVTTSAAFVPGEYEVLLFVDVVPGGGLGPQRGDLAAFDNGICDPTGVSVRVAVGCEDTTVELTNRHFIVF